MGEYCCCCSLIIISIINCTSPKSINLYPTCVTTGDSENGKRYKVIFDIRLPTDHLGVLILRVFTLKKSSKSVPSLLDLVTSITPMVDILKWITLYKKALCVADLMLCNGRKRKRMSHNILLFTAWKIDILFPIRLILTNIFLCFFLFYRSRANVLINYFISHVKSSVKVWAKNFFLKHKVFSSTQLLI